MPALYKGPQGPIALSLSSLSDRKSFVFYSGRNGLAQYEKVPDKIESINRCCDDLFRSVRMLVPNAKGS